MNQMLIDTVEMILYNFQFTTQLHFYYLFVDGISLIFKLCEQITNKIYIFGLRKRVNKMKENT